MNTTRQLFYKHLAQTSVAPSALEITSAEGIYLNDSNGKRYIDLISGIAVSATGHRHPRVMEAIHKQLERYLHVMVYGEFVQEPQVLLAARLAQLLPEVLNTSFFVNSGSEAVEGALKLAKRHTGRNEIIAFKNAYHGSTHGALSVTGSQELKMRYRPLLPSVKHLEFNNLTQLDQITQRTACVIVEPVQGEAGVIPAKKEFLQTLRNRCNETGSLLIFDEIQCGMGRTGSLFAFEGYGVVPDVLLLAKAFGGGLPLGAFISSSEIMNCLNHKPALGHITTFGGHPLSCAAALANLDVIINEKFVEQVIVKSETIENRLKNLPEVREIRKAGLMMAIQFENEKINFSVIENCLKNGLITDWFLFCTDALRVAPPLNINYNQIENAARIISQAITEASSNVK